MSKNTSKPYWPLAVSTFTALDKLKIAWFLFKEPIWTYGEWVKNYENFWVKTFGVKHAIMVSSGSTANELIALRRKHELQQAGEWPLKNKVIFPVNTWISSVSPWINVGFEPVFVDVSKDNLNVTPEVLEKFLKKNRKTVGTVFYTALLGYYNNLPKCKEVTEKYGARFLMDNCEASFSSYKTDSVLPYTKPIITFATCSTSIFFSHFTMSGTEGGLIFCESQEEAEWYRMARSHGLTRGMPSHYKNPAVNADFDFYLMGSNYRSSNLQAYMASLDFDRALKFSYENRREILHALVGSLETFNYTIFKEDPLCVPLAIPILCKTKDHRIKVEAYLKANGIVCRPLIGGCLLAHTAFKGYGDMKNFPIAKWAHECGLYIGLNKDVTLEMAEDLAIKLNKL